MRLFYWLCALVTRRDCRERRIAVAETIAATRSAHATRLQAQRKLDQTLRQLV